MPGDKEGVGGIYNFVTKRGKAAENAKISWTQVETGIGDHVEVSERDSAGRQRGR